VTGQWLLVCLKPEVLSCFQVSSISQWVPGALSLGVKWPGREADYLPSSNAEVKV
jgi:hypothetical protein